MASTYSASLKIELIGTGEQAGVWGVGTNTNLGTAIEEAITGMATATFSADADLTLTLADTNATQVARHLFLNVVSGVSLSTTRNLIVPTVEKQYLVKNATTGSQSIVVKTAAGSGITVPNGLTAHIFTDGTNVVAAINYAPSLALGTALPVTSGGTGATSASAARTALGATTVGSSVFTAANPGAITFLRVNADNTVTLLSAADFRTAIGAGTGTGDVVGPASAVADNIASYNGTTGKLLKDSGKALPSGVLVGTSDTQTLTNKTLTAPTLTTAQNSAGTALLPSYTFSGDVNTGMWSPGADTLAWSTAGAERLRVDASGNVLVTSAAGLGYGTGAGGTVTQATSKTTDVTLSKPCGKITMHNAALGGGASVSFTLNNGIITANDVVVVSVDSFVNYTAQCQRVATGGCTIRVTNFSGGSLSDAVTLNFAVIKGATS